MSLARTRLVVAIFGLAVLAAIAAGLAVVGGPGYGRIDRRDAARLDAVRQIADALVCHVREGADPAEPDFPASISPSCLSHENASRLVDPKSGAPYRIDYPGPGRATICADFERGPRDETAWPVFDAKTGCATVSLTPN